MRKFFFRALFFLIPFLYSIYVSAQPTRDCSTTCFSSEVVSAEKVSETCTSYELKVSYAGACAHALSHFTVAVPCGSIENLWNSENWAQEIGKDPTTGLAGFKIDNTASFGERSLSYFTVKFTICASDEECANEMSCWQPLVAYKASTCVNYQTLSVSCKALEASLEKQDVSCFNAGDGSLSVVVEDGQEPYSFLWSNNSTGESITGLSPGSYSVTIRDESGAELTLEETIGQPEEISLSGTSSSASCNGVADGAVDLTVSGGAGQYSFLWSSGAETEDLQNVTSGAYSVTVQDATNCAVSASFAVGNTSKLEITGSIESPDCSTPNGSIDISVTGGAIPYSFSWTNQATTQNLEGISSGPYTVTVKDGNGCTQDKSFMVNPDNTLALDAVITDAGCNRDATGGIDLKVTGGTAPYTYKWTDPSQSTTEDLANVSSGYYAVKVTDDKNCTINGGYAVSTKTFDVPRDVVQPTCHDGNNGSITLQKPIGGTAPFTYVWEGSEETGTQGTGLTPGVYTVTVTDDTGCSRTVNSTISNPSEISASATVSNTECNGEGSFSIDLEAVGGTDSYTFEWSDGSTAEDRSALESGSYTVTITDDNQCSTSKEIVLGPGTTSLVCTINEPLGTPVCGSGNNALSTSITDADSYLWEVESTDANWSIQGADTPEITYTAGAENSSATFTLTIQKDGCTKTCTYTVSPCTPEDNADGQEPGGGGEDPGGEEPDEVDPEDPGGEEPGGEYPGEDNHNGENANQSCEECFASIVKLLEVSDACRTYEIEVNTNGLCHHDLSHWTLAIPCGTVTNSWNSAGWKMEFGKDPTTGLYGLKVDGINDFGKEEESFTVRFTLCGDGGCNLSSWNPSVAYKAGQCVGVETVSVDQSASTASLAVYPNPFNETVNFEWTGGEENVTLQIFDQYGNALSTVTSTSVENGSRSIALESSALPRGMYYYRLTIEGKTHSGKISKR